MKRLFTLLLAALMLLSCLTALAEGTDDPFFAADLGLSFNMDLKANILDKLDNTMDLSFVGVISHEPYCDVAEVSYCTLSQDTLTEKSSETDAVDDPQKQAEMDSGNHALFANIGEIAVTQLATPEEYMAFVGWNDDEILEITEVGAVDSYHWYYITLPVDGVIARYDELNAFGEDEEDAKAGREKARAEIEFCQAELLKYIEAAEKVAPVDPDSALIGQTIQFESTDLDGNPIKSEDLFRDNEITMINLWGTWCPNCVSEMAELAAINTRLREKGCGVVGIEYEKKPIEEVEEAARAIMTANGTNYPNVLIPGDCPVLNNINVFPSTFFVDSEGVILTFSIIGAAVDEYEAVVDKLLAGEAVDLAPDTGATVNGDNKYCVYVFDQDGNPVEGALVQFCDDVTCSYQPTNADGMAEFPVSEEKVYEVHMLSVPEGYKENPELYKTLDTYSDVNIFLEKAE